MSQRIHKINDLIRDHLANIISKNVSLPRDVFVSITKVDTSKDLRYSRVLVSVFPEDKRESAMKILEKNVFQVQGQLNKLLSCKPLPRIEFISDDTEQKADELEEIFEQIRKERK